MVKAFTSQLTMNRASLLRTFVFINLILGIWVLLIAVRLFGRREIPSESNQNLPSVITRTIIDEEGEREPESNLKGLNQHTWDKPCKISLEQLCNYPIFPKAPDHRTLVGNVDVLSLGDTIAGIRLMGFLRPNETGEYYFLVASNGFAEVWLSTSKEWKNVKKIAYINSQYSRSTVRKVAFDAMKSQISDRVILSAGHEYYFEVIYVQGIQEGKEHLIQVAWKRPEKSRFEIIGRAFLSPYKNERDKAQMRVYDDDLPDVVACEELLIKSSVANEYMRPEALPYLEHTAVKKALNLCEYRPSYLLKPANLLNFKKYHGVHRHTRKTSSYPFPDVTGVLKTRKVSKTFIAEYPLDAKEAILVVSKYFKALKRAYPGKYKLLNIKRVEKKEDPNKGNRFLLELVVKDLTDGVSYILAEYVLQKRESKTSLCYPIGLQWNRTADVYLILTAKNLGLWVHHFIKNVEKLVQETKDEHLHVVIYDFDSPDIDLEQAFQRSTLKNYHFITKAGNYSRTISFSEAIQSIKDPNAIVVTIDLHLDIGSRLIDDVRKHCIKGKMVYAPQIVFLNCDGSSALPRGSWYHYSYGTIATYKQDWQNFGGFSKDFFNKTTWGGEDWDIIDGAVKGGLEIERKRSPWIYHYYHSKKGMWRPPEKKVKPKVKVAPQTKIATKKKDIVPKEATLHKESTLRKDTTRQNNALRQKEASRQKEVLTQKEAVPPRELHSKEESPPQQKDHPPKGASPQKGTHLRKEATPHKEIHLQKENPSVKVPSQNEDPIKLKPIPKINAQPQKEISRQKEVVARKKAPPPPQHDDHSQKGKLSP